MIFKWDGKCKASIQISKKQTNKQTKISNKGMMIHIWRESISWMNTTNRKPDYKGEEGDKTIFRRHQKVQRVFSFKDGRSIIAWGEKRTRRGTLVGNSLEGIKNEGSQRGERKK